MKKLTILGLALMILLWSCGAATSENAENEAVTEDTTLHSEKNKEDISEKTLEEKTDEIVEENKEARPQKKAAPMVKEVATKEKSSKLVSLKTTTSDFSKDYLMGKFNPATHPDFTEIQTKHASKGGMHLRKDAYAAFQQMYDAAKADGVYLKIISATRPFHHQKSIWEAKWNGKRKVNGRFLPANPRDPEQRALLILMFSSMPGTSRHHWGTDIDLNDLNNPYFESGTGKKIYDWLVENAATYGFCQVYSPMGDDRPNGYQEEKWHWSYVPVARKLTNLYKEKLTNADITGFEGSETAQSIDMISNYVLGINPDCK